jgi:hypothetical protein
MLSFSSVDDVMVAGTSGADHLISSGSIVQPLSFSGSGGSDTFEVESGAYTFAGDAHDLSAGGSVAVIVDAGASVIFNSTQRLRDLTISDGATATLSSDGSRFLHAVSLSIAPTGTLDLADNDLILDTTSYSDARALVAAGFGHSTGGITSSTSTGSQVLALFDNAFAGYDNWQGEPIGASAIVGKYTYFGDVNFDGQVTGDDYTVVDANLNTAPYAGIAWLRGDANVDGQVTGDDYTAIDSNVGSGVGNPLAPLSLQDPPRQSLMSESFADFA